MKLFKQALALFLALVMSHLTETALAATPGQMVSTVEYVEQVTRAQAEEQIRSQVNRVDVRKELERLGVSPDEVSAKMASLTDSELRDIASQMDSAQHGGIIGILVVVVLVLLIIYLAKRI
jgi:predicted neutral ceramidase superfamily lipid hydrolase